ncbi:hypothetical protein ORU18_15515 [Vibrio parahaemolyticus]|uniref:hypothetical protein n=1 Tax=Vibrio parahaemolyticus TaxID=670 RepID=UPI00225796D6|nr:hypothetical protein [Vibrio parahaemolyticus]MCX4120534.1 hypothetical protein [Vibrio parahaemolyticus]
MVNKYLNKIKKDFENAKWDARIKNYDDSPFPQVLSDKLAIGSAQNRPETVVFANKHKANKVITRQSALNDAWLLPTETKMVFVLYLNDKLASTTIYSACKEVLNALSVLTLSPYQPHELTQDRYSQCIEKPGQNAINRFNYFINWCVEKQYCESIRPNKISMGGNYDGAKRNKEKLPEVSSILALGDIFCQCIPENRARWDTSVNSNQANALASMASALSLAAPNRMCAEVITLQSQELYGFETPNSDGETVTLHSLMWQGSKHYKDNENHIGSWMAEQIERGIEYFDLVTQPYRVLAAFWLDQEGSIQELFPTMDATVKQRLNTTRLTHFDTPSFIQLGYLLGFYKNDSFQINTKGEKHQKSTVHISELSANFRVYCNRESGVGELLGYGRLSETISIIKAGLVTLKNFHSIKELQDAIFQVMYNSWPSFPDLSMGEGANKRHISHAMWCLNSASIGGGGGFYQLVSASKINGLIERKLTKGRLFEGFNFSIRLKVSPHKLRHYINHNGYINGIPDYILNMWSGRQDSKHLLYYVHEEDEDKLARIPMLTEQVKGDNISVSTEEEFAQARGFVPGATSRTSVGFCSKDLRYSPCTYLSRFETQCTFCEHSCHIAHDENGIRVLKEDHQIQCERLNTHLSSPQKNNENAKKWFKMHKANVYLLEQLIETLEDKSIAAGSVVRVITDVQQIRIADLKTKTITNKKFRLDVMEKDIQEGLKLLDYSQEKTQRDIDMDNFLDELWGDL